MIPLTDNEEQKKCHICQKRFYCNKKEKKIYKLYRKVRDHCHFTGKFRGAAQGICNLRYKVPHEIPVRFSVPINKECIHDTNEINLIDLCAVIYQVLLIIYLKLKIMENV